MNHSSTTQSWGTLNLSTLKKIGSEYHGPCPVTGEGKDCFWVKPDARLIGCRGCAVNGLSGPQFTEHLSAIGGSIGERDGLAPYDWTNYLTGEIVTQTRPGGEQKYLWPKGAKPGTLVYLARFDRTSDRSLVFCEGAKAALAAASKLPVDDYDVIAFASSSTIPNDATLKALSRGRSCVIWPDDDVPGAKVATRLVSALRQAAADVVTVDPALLGLTGGHGHDAAEWKLGKNPKGEFEAACRVEPITKLHRFKLVWDIEAQPDPRAVVPGLLYEGYQTVIEAGPKWGKTTLLVDAVAAAYASSEWLGESCDQPGPILWISEMAEPLIRAWLARRLPEGVKPNIYVSPICSLTELAAAVEEIHPCAVIVDSFIAAFRAERPNSGKPDEWRAGDVREFFTRLREICPTSLTTNHVRKSDGAGRDSGDLHAASDLLIELRDKDGNRRYSAPELSDRRRTLHYAGRILHGRVTHCLMGADFGFTVVDGGNTSGGGGGSDVFTAGEPVDPLDAKIDGYLMRHPEGVSQNAVRKAVRGARVNGLVARLKVVGTLGPDKLWRRATDALSPPPKQAVPDSQPPPVGNSGTGGAVPAVPVNGNKGGTGTGTGSGTGSHPIGEPPAGTGSRNRFREPVAGSENTPPSLPTGGSGEPAKDHEAMAEHVGCLACRGTGLDGQGNPCGQDWYMDPHGERQKRGVPPVTHTTGVKKWDDATSTWVDTVPDDDVWNAGLSNGVHLSDGTSVTDGDPRIHWDESWNEGEQEEMVH